MPGYGPIGSYPIEGPDSLSVVVAAETGDAGGARQSSRRRLRHIPRVLDGVGSIRIGAPRLRAIGSVATTGIAAVEIGEANVSGTGTLAIHGTGQTRAKSAAEGLGMVCHLTRAVASSPVRRIDGSGSVVVRVMVKALGDLADQVPVLDVVDTAWLDLQRQIAEEDDLLLAVGVLD